MMYHRNSREQGAGQSAWPGRQGPPWSRQAHGRPFGPAAMEACPAGQGLRLDAQERDTMLAANVGKGPLFRVFQKGRDT